MPALHTRGRLIASASALAALVALMASPAAASAAETEAKAAEIVSDQTVTGPDGSAFGATASQVSCDVNGNGAPDLAVGTYATFDTTPGATGAYVLIDAGEQTPSGEIGELNPVRILDTAKNQMGGVDVRCAGDVNGDGFDDLVVVAQAVGAYLVFGSEDFSEIGLDALGERGRAVLGSATRGNGIGDVDGDGRDEVAITDTQGTVTILNAEDLAQESALADAPGPRVSGEGIDLVSVSRVGDMNGDGREDLAVGAASWTAPGSTGMGTGAIWVITDLSADVAVGDVAIPGFRIDGPPRGYDLLGTSTVGLGDIDGDGFGDLLIGGESDDPLPGSAVVVTGGPDGENVSSDPLTTSGYAVRSDSDGTRRGWWLNGVASGDHFGHAVGAARMDGWSMLLAGGMDGSPVAERAGSGYAIAVDSRALVASELPASDSGVIEASDLIDGSIAGATPIIGALADQRLGRSFADLTADPTSTRVTFAIGAPALFSWQELPSVRIVSVEVPATLEPEPEPEPEPQPGPDPDNGDDGGDGDDAGGADEPDDDSVDQGSAPISSASEDETKATRTDDLAQTGTSDTALTAAGCLLVAGIAVLGAARARRSRARA